MADQKYTFPKDFLIGCASASYQVEGGWNADDDLKDQKKNTEEYTTSETNIFEDHYVNKITSLTLNVRDIVACVYDNQWWLAEVKNVSLENADVFVHFYHPAGPRTSFKKSNNDRVWISLKNVLRKLSVLELTTATGRSYSIPQNLSEEISVLLTNHLN